MNNILKIILVLTIFTIIINSCKKEDEANPCELVVQDDFELVP